MATLGDLESEPFETAPSDGQAVTAPRARWVVLVGEAGPVSAIAPGTTVPEGARLPGILVASAGSDLAVALRSAAFEHFADVGALVVTEPAAGWPAGGPAGWREPGPQIVGLVGGQMLTRLMQRGPVRGISGPVLPGSPSIIWITRSCGYVDAGTACATLMSFVSRPYPMPGCDNTQGLPAHQFVW
jgi:hypothetical protein